MRALSKEEGTFENYKLSPNEMDGSFTGIISRGGARPEGNLFNTVDNEDQAKSKQREGSKGHNRYWSYASPSK